MITISHMVDSLCQKQAPKPEFQLRNALYALGTYAELANFGPQQHLQRVMGRFLSGANSQTSGDHQKKLCTWLKVGVERVGSPCPYLAHWAGIDWRGSLSSKSWSFDPSFVKFPV